MRWEEYINFASSKLVEKAIYFCENAECEDCPIYINDIDHRTQYEKEVMFVPCVDNLIFELANGRTLN